MTDTVQARKKQAKKPETLVYKRGHLLYHSSHGPCRVKDVIKQMEAGKEHFFYSLESKQNRFRGARFLIDSTQVETSGFHPAISAQEASKILRYLETTDPEDRELGITQPKVILHLIEQNAPWSFARVVLIYAREKDGKGAKGKREMLSRAARGLVRELSFSLEIPEEEAITKMKKSIKRGSRTNSWVTDTISSILD